MFHWFSKLSEIAKLLGRSFRDWSEWAQREPLAAADQLDTVARVFRHRAGAYRRQAGWRARRDRAFAKALVEQAKELRASDGDRLKRACAVRPGRYA